MSSRQVFKPSIFKQILAWTFTAAAAGAMLALDGWLLVTWRRQPSDELWAGLAISAFLLILALLGAAFLRTYFVLTGDSIEIVRPLGTQIFRVPELGGYGRMTIVVNLVPLHQIRLYGFGLKQVGGIAINGGDRARIEEWFSARLPLVTDSGSIAIPKPRYADDRGRQRDPTFRG
ncbi:MAG TPA: hypothetical protein VGL53_22085 [Bryobacteraceae bacterium]|jgi:hypothetical protein